MNGLSAGTRKGVHYREVAVRRGSTVTNESGPMILIFFLCFYHEQEEVLWISWEKTSVVCR